IDEAIELYRAVLTIPALPPQHRANCLTCLSAAVQTRFKHRGDIKDRNEALELLVGSLPFLAVPHFRQTNSLLNLAYVVQTRFNQRGDSRDINKAIELYREGLTLHPSPHPNHADILNNLANAVCTRFERQGNPGDLTEAIALHRAALALYQPPHPNRSMSLNSLALVVTTRFYELGNIKDLFEAIKLLGEALDICIPPHPDRGVILMRRGTCLALVYTRTKNSYALDRAFVLFQEAVTYLGSPPLTRFHHAHCWAKMAALFSHFSSLAAYTAAIELLPQLVAPHLALPSRQQIVSTIDVTSLASGACTCAISLKQYSRAVELLEASRSIFWSQALHLRAPLNDLATIHPDLSDKLAKLSPQLEQASFRDTSRDILTNTANQHKVISMEAEGARSFRLNEEWEETVKYIRMISGFEDFMQPKRMVQLQQAALRGPIVVLHCGEVSSNALVINSLVPVQCVPLPKLPRCMVQVFANTLQAASSSKSMNIDDLFNNHERTITGSDQSLFIRLFGQREDSETGNISANAVFAGILELLWEWMVLPIFGVLHLERSFSPPRLWWCPTGPFAFLPIHAAGVYRSDGTDCVSDYVVSSYTPTITALLDPPSHTATSFKMTVVIEPEAPNCSPLPGAHQELRKIAERVPNKWLTTLGDTSPATIATALIHLRESSIVHFACHGIQDLKQPLDSGLILTNGRLKVSDIMFKPQNENIKDVEKTMSLAFLSACETAQGDTTTPDEAMHLAATLLFVGFRGVVATMGIMDDRDGPRIANTFYQHLFKDCDPTYSPPILPDLTKSAEALHVAVVKLRQEPDIEFKRWVPFVHYGV
ncbi:CHAT domain-containing protein, partial [Mycena epipterygia]